MSVKLYVGNLASEVSEEDIRDKFNEFGYIEDIHLIIDRETGQSKGFAFVDMQNEDDAEMAIDDLEGMDWKGRPLQINKARVPPSRGGRGRY